jgi:hypothetical protein
MYNTCVLDPQLRAHDDGLCQGRRLFYLRAGKFSHMTGRALYGDGENVPVEFVAADVGWSCVEIETISLTYGSGFTREAGDAVQGTGCAAGRG